METMWQLVMLGFLVAPTASGATATGSIPLDSGWTLSGDDTRVEGVRGEPALRLRNGLAVRPEVVFQDGTIEFDLEVTPHRAFVYLQFRRQSDRDFEAIYFRTHKSELPDAVQYDPVWNGESAWQLFHDANSTAAVTFPRSEWIHVRLVVKGRRGELFVGPAPAPALVMRLERDPAPGSIAFRAFTPEGAATAGVSTGTIARVVVRPGVVPEGFGAEPPPVEPPPEGTLGRWQLSPPFPHPKEPVAAPPAELLARRAEWPALAVEANGLLIVGRHVARPAPSSAVLARQAVTSDRAQSVRLRLGWSDFVTVFVNGRPVFSGDAHYSFDRPRQEGLIGLHQATLWLALEPGENEILFALADSFGGWGLIGQLEPKPGVTVRE